MRNIKYIIVHHSGTEDGKICEFQAIRGWHIHHNCWIDIGYHFGIERIGKEWNWEVLVGRPLHWVGAHARGHNNNSIGICFVGNYSKVKPSHKMIQIAVRRIIVPLVKTFNVPLENILPHRAVNNTSCPGKMFEMEYLIDEIQRRLK